MARSYNAARVIGCEGPEAEKLARALDKLAGRNRLAIRNYRSGVVGIVLQHKGWRCINQAWTWSPPGFLVQAAAAEGLDEERLCQLLAASRFAGKPPGACGRALIREVEGATRVFDFATGADLGPVAVLS